MLYSIALILLAGMALAWLCRKLHLPGLVGMIATGILLGPYVCNGIDGALLNISADLRRIALIIILTRAGLTLHVEDLKKVGRPAVLMCFVPATLEILGMLLLAPRLLGISLLDAAIMGAVVGAVSPAVIVPKMIRLMEEGYGTEKGIPQLILAGASVDDVFVIVLFSAFTGLAQGQKISVMSFVNIPISIVLGIGMGVLTGWLLAVYFERVHVRDTVKVLILLSIAFLLVSLEDGLRLSITFSALIAVMFLGIALQKRRAVVAKRLSVKFNKLWVGAEILLFVLVGASVDIRYVAKAGLAAVVLILGVLCFRALGVFLCLLGTKLNAKERLFCILAYLPKATVQAAIGGIPLAMGFSCGNVVLTVAVLAILITAPLGAFLMENSYRRLLSCKQEEIVPACKEDLDRILAIYDVAKRYMHENGNPNQWNGAYPDRSILEEDIRKERLYVYKKDGIIHGVFVLLLEEEPTYSYIEDGSWEEDMPYGTIHRLAGDGQVQGLFAKCVSFCEDKVPNLRADTHRDNHIMQHLLEKNGFERRGIIYLRDGNPRIAYQKRQKSV